MDIFVYLLLALWLLSITKSSLFWIYLLQLKEYRLNRFLDHFSTEKGQKLLRDKLTFGTLLVLLISPFFGSNIIYLGLILYFGKAVLFFKSLLDKSIKKPDFTSKSIPLVGILIFLNLVIGIWSLLHFEIAGFATILITLDLILPLTAILSVSLLKPLNKILRRKTMNVAKEKRGELENLLVIGITGSYGKTSTKEFLYEILKEKFKVIKTPEHMNTEIGVASFVLNNLSQKYEIFICEMGAYIKGEIREICDIVQPKIGVFVGANEQHLALFGSMENLLSAEGGKELLESLPKGGLAIFNGNNRYAYELYREAAVTKRITYAPNLVDIINPEKRDVRAENIEVEKDYIKFRVVSNKDSKGAEFRLELLGAHNIENILLAVAVAEELGLSLEEIAKACRKIRPLERTMSKSINASGLAIINSTYSSNPTAVKAHLEYLKSWGDSKKIVVMPCLIELGKASEKSHKQIGKDLASVADLAIITTKDRFEDLLSGASEAIGSEKAKEKIQYIEDVGEIVKIIGNSAGKDDVVLLEGRLSTQLIDKLTN